MCDQFWDFAGALFRGARNLSCKVEICILSSIVIITTLLWYFTAIFVDNTQTISRGDVLSSNVWVLKLETISYGQFPQLCGSL